VRVQFPPCDVTHLGRDGKPSVSGHQAAVLEGDLGHDLDTAGQEPLLYHPEQLGVR
jgi:hypothetical protein